MKKFFASFVLLAALTAHSFATDIAITAANVVPSAKARFTTQTAGVAVTAGQVLYFDTSTGTVKLAKANGASPQNTVYGIAMSTAAVNQPVVVCTYDPNLAIGGTIASGTICWLSVLNAGGINSTGADDVAGGTMTRIVLGPGVGSNTINFSPIAGGVIP